MLVPHEPLPGQVALRWLGQGGFAFRSPGGLVWCVDPYLSSYSGRADFQRLAPTPVAADSLITDAVLCSHAHSVHTDPVSLPMIAAVSPQARFYAAAEGAQKMSDLGIPSGRIETVQAGDRAVPLRGTARSGVEGSAGRAAPPDVLADVVFASHSGDAVGFVFHVGVTPPTPAIDSPSAAVPPADFGSAAAPAVRPFRIYVTGDTLYDPQLLSQTTRGVDLLCVCINGRGGNMTHEEAARLAGELGATTVIPMHFGVMPHNTLDPQLFLDALAAQGVQSTPRVLGIGETLVLGT
ncbi:MAG: MBL fold metallo-hydrolase [Chloroflexota bacterium]|nr:MBL fold metallo-hydrolase [Chloroflexota bacterium]